MSAQHPLTPRLGHLVLVMSLVGFVLAGCGGDGSVESTTTAAAPTTNVAAPSPALAGGRVPVSGTGNCDCDFPSAQEEGEVLVLTGTCTCIAHTSDSRVSGREELPMTLSVFSGFDPEVHWFEYNDATFTNEEGGSWSGGEGFGSEFFDQNGDLKTTGYTRYVGEGAYEGLVYEYFYGQSNDFGPESDPHESYRISGWIEHAYPETDG